MKKIEKDFVLTDSSVNTYGFGLLTSGYQLSEFAKNPIGYYMHGTDEHPREQGVLVRWESLRIDGDKVYGKPSINAVHPRAERTLHELETGFLNAASCGHFVVIESSDDPSLKMPGQTGPTITKWYNRECSLVDIPANMNALCPPNLYDTRGQILSLQQLSASSKASIPNNEQKSYPLKDFVVSFIISKDITEDTGTELLKQFENVSFKLMDILDSFCKMRIQYLMSMDWLELDKSGLGEELAQKYYTGYNLKRYLQFGKTKSSVIDNNYFLKFAVKNGYIKNDEEWMYEEGGGNTAPVIFNKIYAAIEQSTRYLIESDWDKLSYAQLERLKVEAFTAYKQKYFKQFGVLYKRGSK